MRIAPINLIDFDEPVAASATSVPMIPHAAFVAAMLLGMAGDKARRTPGIKRIRVSIPEGMRVRIRCA